MVERKTPGEIILLVFIYAAVTLVGFVCLYPMLYCLAASFSDPMKLLTHSGALFFPTGFSLRGYQVVMNNPNILIGYRNTLLYVAGSLIVGMTLTPLGAYALSCKGYPFRKAIVFLFVFTMYFSSGMVPNFLTISAYGMYNTAWAIILPTAVSTYNMIVMRTTFAAVPEALRESAYIDGANDFVILYRIYIPVSKATMAVIILFYVVSQWNSWFPAMIYLRDSKKWPLQMILREILINDAAGGISDDADAQYLQELIKYCTIIVATVPILCIYPFVQKYFMKGVMLGSVKG